MFMFILNFAYVEAEESCDGLGVLVYEDLGCQAVKRPGKKCPVKGTKYALNEKIDQDVTYESCNVGCFCNRHLDATRFTCAILDCPEWLGVPVKFGCFRKYEVDKCCSVGMNCPSDDNPLEDCDVGGKKYKEGEKFFPKDTCMKCVCSKNFNGKLESPFCKRLSCGVQINHAEELHNRCAPTYVKPYGESLCCPDTWVCPTSSDKVTKINPEAEADSVGVPSSR
ncbi:hypothetical protein NQ318_023207 [Aromia moschata]|uniref:VWFC domain-containing protein n=1 Tax=Aromia moschata TaxID=1265417 RepID=A0AAV8X752_9CUCU|nr:hypothetical protein NQ318_023207 [Aromia moschata]